MNLNTGLALRLEFIDDFLTKEHSVKNFEVIADNWLSPGPHHKKLSQLAESKNVYFHCVGMNIAGLDELNFSYLNQIKELINKFNPIHISDHLCFQRQNKNCHHDLLPFPYNNDSFNRVAERVARLQEHFNCPLLIENLSYYLQFNKSTMSEVEFLNALCKKTGCYLLLDLNNILVNEQNLSLSATNYLDEVNFDYVKEIHVAGAQPNMDLIVDDHGEDLDPRVLDLLNSIRTKIKQPCIAFYERDTRLPSFKHLLLQHQILAKEAKHV